MNVEQLNTYRSFRRVQEYLANQPIADLPAAVGTQLGVLDGVVSQLSKETLDQEAGHRLTKAESAKQRGLRAELWRQHMMPVSRVAREVFGVTGMDKALHMPKHTLANEAVVTAANAMAEAAETQQAVFVEHGLAPDFAAKLREAASTLDQSLGARDTTRRRRVTATAAVKDVLKRGQRAVRLLNAILAPKLASNPDLLAAWNNVRKLRPVPALSAANALSTAVPVVEAPTAAPAPVVKAA